MRTCLDEFFNFLVLLCIDELAIVNILYMKSKLFGPPRHIETTKRSVENVLINLFQKQGKMSLQSIMETLHKKVINEKIDVEGSINNIANFNSKTKTFQLKDEYLSIYEPFIFVRDPQILVEVQQNLQNRFKNDKQIQDFIVGNQSYVYKFENSILNKVQAKLFDLPLMDFLSGMPLK